MIDVLVWLPVDLFGFGTCHKGWFHGAAVVYGEIVYYHCYPIALDDS